MGNADERATGEAAAFAADTAPIDRYGLRIADDKDVLQSSERLAAHGDHELRINFGKNVPPEGLAEREGAFPVGQSLPAR